MMLNCYNYVEVFSKIDPIWSDSGLESCYHLEQIFSVMYSFRAASIEINKLNATCKRSELNSVFLFTLIGVLGLSLRSMHGGLRSLD